MRPLHRFSDWLDDSSSDSSPCSDSGLIHNRGVGYHRPKLPDRSAPVEMPFGPNELADRNGDLSPAGDELTADREAEMEHRRPQAETPDGRRPDAADNGSETRAQRLQRIRREIELGTYETPEKLEAALDRMFGVLIDS